MFLLALKYNSKNNTLLLPSTLGSALMNFLSSLLVEKDSLNFRLILAVGPKIITPYLILLDPYLSIMDFTMSFMSWKFLFEFRAVELIATARSTAGILGLSEGNGQ